METLADSGREQLYSADWTLSGATARERYYLAALAHFYTNVDTVD